MTIEQWAADKLGEWNPTDVTLMANAAGSAMFARGEIESHSLACLIVREQIAIWDRAGRIDTLGSWQAALAAADAKIRAEYGAAEYMATCAALAAAGAEVRTEADVSPLCADDDIRRQEADAEFRLVSGGAR